MKKFLLIMVLTGMGAMISRGCLADTLPEVDHTGRRLAEAALISADVCAAVLNIAQMSEGGRTMGVLGVALGAGSIALGLSGDAEYGSGLMGAGIVAIAVGGIRALRSSDRTSADGAGLHVAPAMITGASDRFSAGFAAIIDF